MHTVVAGWGDLGRRLGQRLVHAGGQVTGIRRADTEPGDVPVVACDLRRVEAGALAHLNAQQLVLCLAPDARSPEAYRTTYRDAPLRAVAALGPVDRVLFVSSTSVHGESPVPGEWIDEGSPAHPSRWQGESLLEAETALRERFPGLIVTRAAGLYGPGRNWMLRRAASGEPGTARWTNRIHIDDAAAALAHILSLKAPQPLYLLADGAPEPEDRLLEALRREMGRPGPRAPAVHDACAGRRIRPRALLDSGFHFAYPDFLAGYRELLRQGGAVGL